MTQRDYQNAVGVAKFYSHMYYVKSNPVISDAEFDALVAQIEQTESEHPEWTLKDSPTQKVGSDLKEGRGKVAHRTPMLSCQKAQSVDKVNQWLAKVNPQINQWLGRYVMMWKYDGISCSLVYQDGQLIEASTRGDGMTGQNILEHVCMMQNVPQQLKPSNERFADFVKKNNTLSGRIEVRGEIVCPKENLRMMRGGYKDCRSAASSVCNKDYASMDCELLKLMPWEVIADGWNYGPEFNIGLDIIGQCGFEPVYYVCSNLEGGTDFAPMLESKFNNDKREALKYPTDGVVIRVNHRGDFNSLGFTEHHPKGSIAYKFAAQKVQTVCRRIEVSVGRTGKRTPVAYFDAVTILGREVTQASLYSEKTASELGIKPGDVIEVGLSNDVTPKVYRVVGTSTGSVTAEPEERWEQRYLFEDGDTSTDSVTVEDESTGKKILKGAMMVCSVIGVCVITVLGVALACFGIPLLNGSFK